VPVNTWSYIGEQGLVRHAGPFAEDSHGAFGLGATSTAIGLQDIDGVNFAAIQALETRTRQQDATYRSRIAELERQLEALQKVVADLARRPN
jgi:hypothetical protein